MLNYTDNYSLGWAQRFCVEHQPEELIREYYHWFVDNVAGIISEEQASRLIWDLENNYLPGEYRLQSHYPDEHEIPESLYVYLDLLKGIKNNTDKDSDEDKPETCGVVDNIWPMVKWASQYCMGRRSYAASYITDVVEHYYKRMSAEQVQELARLIKEYKEFCEENERKFIEENPDFYERHPYMREDCPSKEWIKFLDFANPDNRKLVRHSPDLIDHNTFEPIIPRPTDIKIYETYAFWNSVDKQYNPVNEYIEKPFRHYFIDNNTIIND